MSFILQEKKGNIGIITLNRAEKRNALNANFISELRSGFLEYAEDEEVKVIILKAEGKVFSAGADLKYLQELQQNSFEENLEDSNNMKELFLQIYRMEKVVIAEVQGHAIAGGCGLMSVCDYAFSVPEAKFGYTEVKIGFIPAIVMVFLLRKLTEAKAKEILLNGQLINSERAHEIGLINKIIPQEELTTFTESFAQELIEVNSAASMGLAKRLISQVQGMGLDEALDLAAKTNAQVRESKDCKKGIAAFLDGEKVIW